LPGLRVYAALNGRENSSRLDVSIVLYRGDSNDNNAATACRGPTKATTATENSRQDSFTRRAKKRAALA
jgi:hypothetical protein